MTNEQLPSSAETIETNSVESPVGAVSDMQKQMQKSLITSVPTSEEFDEEDRRYTEGGHMPGRI